MPASVVDEFDLIEKRITESSRPNAFNKVISEPDSPTDLDKGNNTDLV